MKEALSILAGAIVLYSYIPYAKDILKGKVRPARSARVMITLLIIIALFQQLSLHSGWLLALTVGELIGALGIFMFAIKRGVGGWTRIDIICYGLLFIDLLVWYYSGNALAALHLSIIADVIAMTPVLIKTWLRPYTETPLFFALAVIAPLLNIVAVGNYNYAVVVFPAYIALINFITVALILFRQRQIPSPHNVVQDHQPIN